RVEGDDHLVVRLDVPDVLADLLDRAGRLMAEDHRQRVAGPVPRAVDDVVVRVAGASRVHPDEHLVVLRPFERDLPDWHWLVGLVQHGGAHIATPSTVWLPSYAVSRRFTCANSASLW